MNDKPRPRWFRFSLRTMLVVITALCCYLGWESSIVRARKALLKELQLNPAFTVVTAEEWTRRYPSGGHPSDQPPRSVSWVRRGLGDQAIQEVGYYSYYAESRQVDLARIRRVFPEAALRQDHPPQVPCHPGCFPRGTLVETPQGPRLIETIEVGDVLTAAQRRGEISTASVKSVFVTTNQLWQVETTAGTLLTTQIQPLCLATYEIVPAGQLQPGQTILHYEAGAVQPVEVLSVTPTERIETVINLVLAGGDLFIAGGYVARSKPPLIAAGE